jgi:hypothetical protein
MAGSGFFQLALTATFCRRQFIFQPPAQILDFVLVVALLPLQRRLVGLALSPKLRGRFLL